MTRRLLFVLCFAGMCATPARAQESGRFAVGLNVGVRLPLDSSAVRGNKAGGIFWRYGHNKEGWHWSYGLGWYSTDADWNVGGQKVELGELKVRPLMAGYGYSHLIGRYTLSADMVGGYVWARINEHPQFIDAYRARTGVDASDVDISNTFALRPGVSLWYDINKKFGLNVAGNFTVARPNVTITSPTGVEIRRLHADMFTIHAGVVYSIF